MEYTLTLRRYDEVADQTRMLVFGRPEGFVFEAGQYVALKFEPQQLVAQDERGGVRSFSLASAPGDDEICFVMREGITGFKKTMWSLQPGDTVGCTKAVGHCTLPPLSDSSRPIVLLAGGVGIAPVRSVLRYASQVKDPRSYSLFYSNRYIKDAAFHAELLEWPLSQFTYVWTLSDEAEPPKGRNEERGYITADMIRKHLPEWQSAHYYVIGAPGFATAMKTLLLDMGISEAEIKIDPFTGLTGPAVTKNL
jgi:ferredoxin-NADP reductase